MNPYRRLLTGAALATVCGAGALLAANLGVAAHRYGMEYLRRLALWGRRESMDDPARFPARPIAPAARPFRFDGDPTGPAQLRGAFRDVAARHGLDAEEGLEAFLARTRTTSLLVLRGDRLAYEGYANGAARGEPLTSMSMAKSVLGLLAAAAVADGLIPGGFDASAETLLPEVPGLRGSGVTLRHLLRMASGLRFEDPAPLGPLTWRLLFAGGRVAYFTSDIRAYVETARPGPDAPGARFAYDDRGAQLVGLALARAFGRSVSDVLGGRIWRRIGAEYPASWSLDRAGGLEKMESGLNAAALDWLKIGRLVLREGRWDDGDGRVLPAALLAEATLPPRRPDPPGFYAPGSAFAQAPGPSYGLLWYVAAPAGPGPPDCYAAGLFGQILYVARTRDAVLLRTGLGDRGVPSWPALLGDLATALQDAAGAPG